MRPLLLCLFLVLLFGPVRGAEPFFQKGDVIALVGGEDMVVASEYGYLELLLTRALPDYHLRFRNLAWEGDTVFEQRRDLNFPSYEEQLDKIGATVVIAQFGQMESLMGTAAPGFPTSGSAGIRPPGSGVSRSTGETLPAGIAEFIAAYEKLIQGFSAGGKRRVVLFGPSYRNGAQRNPALAAWEYWGEIWRLADRMGCFSANLALGREPRETLNWTRDGIHLTRDGHRGAARVSLVYADKSKEAFGAESSDSPFVVIEENNPLLALIRAKNRLWFDYWRPQNWAFLAGDRTAQPSSRDHLDPSKRWFPPEREAFLPLLEAKEKEIDALAAQPARPEAL